MRILIACCLVFCFSRSFCQQTPIIKFDKLEKIIHSKSDSILVVNFWATWCAPCIKELPYFEDLHQKKPEIKVLLVNLDFAEKVDKVDQFIQRKKMSSPVMLLDEIDYNAWIDKVDKNWGGAIPATLLINQKTGQRKFVDHELTAYELQNLLNSIKQ